MCGRISVTEKHAPTPLSKRRAENNALHDKLSVFHSSCSLAHLHLSAHHKGTAGSTSRAGVSTLKQALKLLNASVSTPEEGNRPVDFSVAASAPACGRCTFACLGTCTKPTNRLIFSSISISGHHQEREREIWSKFLSDISYPYLSLIRNTGE